MATNRLNQISVATLCLIVGSGMALTGWFWVANAEYRRDRLGYLLDRPELLLSVNPALLAAALLSAVLIVFGVVWLVDGLTSRSSRIPTS